MRKQLICILLLFLFLVSTASAATLNVGKNEKYKTVQSAIKAAKSGDTIKVASGTYKENILIANKKLTLLGTNHPTIYGIRFINGGQGIINGFTVTKKGIDLGKHGYNTVRNCILSNCNIIVTGFACSGNTIKNNKLTNGTIELYETLDNYVVGNYIYGSKIGFCMDECSTCKSITKNTFTKCLVGVQLTSVPVSMVKNKYINNKINIKIVDYA